MIVVSWRRLALITPFPIDDIPERPALEIGAQIVAEEIDGLLAAGRQTFVRIIPGDRDLRRHRCRNQSDCEHFEFAA